MPLVAENCIHNSCDGSCFIRASIHIEHWDGMSEFPCGQPVPLYIVAVHELAGGFAVYECGPRLDLCHISGLNFHLDNQRLRAGGSCHHVSFQEVLFPLAEVERMGCQS